MISVTVNHQHIHRANRWPPTPHVIAPSSTFVSLFSNQCSVLFTSMCISDGQISPKKQTKQLFVWQLLPNDYIQSILLAPGNAKSNVKMQKKKKKKNLMKNHGGPCPTFQGHIKSSSKLVRPSDLLRPFCLDHSLWQDPQNIFHLPPPTLRSAQGGIGGQYLIACN